MQGQADVLVVGGGPAGLSAARAAAQSGAKVTLIEREREIGYPIHSSGGSWIADIREYGIDEDLYNPIHVLKIASPHELASFEYPQARACVLDVRRTYQRLAELACDEGADIRLLTSFKRALVEGDAVAGCLAKTPAGTEEIRAPITIDASGFSAVLSRDLGAFGGFRRFGQGAELDLYAPAWPETECLLAMGSDVGLGGYAWVYPYGGGRVRVGVGVVRPAQTERPQTLLPRFIRGHRCVAAVLCEARAIEYHEGIVPSEPFDGELAGNGFVVAGDSGAQVSAIAGEGIRFALEAGQLAGSSAARAVACGQCDGGSLQEYARAWAAKHGSHLDLAHSINRRIAAFDDDSWDRWVGSLSGLRPDTFADLLRGDFSRKLAMRIITERPSLASSFTLNMILSRFGKKKEPRTD